MDIVTCLTWVISLNSAQIQGSGFHYFLCFLFVINEEGRQLVQVPAVYEQFEAGPSNFGVTLP